MAQAPEQAAPHPWRIISVLALTVATGSVDVATFMRLGEVFASVMTGNIVLLGLSVGRGLGTLAAHGGVAIAGYAAGSALGTIVAGADAGSGPLWSRRATAALGTELAVLVGLTVGWELTGGDPSGGTQLVLLALAALAMGTQSGTVRRLGVAGLSTTYMTGTLTAVAADLVTGKRPSVAAPQLAVLLCLGAGAAVGGVLVAEATSAVPVLWLGLLAAVIGGAVVVARRDRLTHTRA